VGYADVRSIYLIPPGETSTWRSRLRWRLRGVASRAMMRGVHQVVVETPSFADALATRGFPAARIAVVPNTVNELFMDSEVTEAPTAADRTAWTLVYVTRPYPHKNLPFLGALHDAAQRRHGVSLRYLLTMTTEEVDVCLPGNADAVVALGVVTPAELPEIYARADAAIFPSLLESFSVMPLEAMICGRIVFASDRGFVRSTCGEAPVYIDPLDADSAADVLVATLRDPDRVREHIRRGRDLASSGSARDRAAAYAELISRQLETL
jgi:glycosyltransferase involved in cell wall biosynthesis